ncbi:MAG: hypothetical protein HFG26_08860 [Provencibacterium sp.]|jgi:hypothetical protein|nr:hypothetical protein [Provencibacterium sp.]
MSLIGKVQNGQCYAPGWFLANNEDCTRETRQIAQAGAETGPNGSKYVKMGTVYPANDNTAEGIVYEDVDVSTGDMPGSVVTAGEVYEDRLPAALAEEAKTALTGKGFTFRTAPSVTRPY